MRTWRAPDVRIDVGGIRYPWGVDELDADLARLAWEGIDLPYSMTVVEGLDEDEVIRRLGGDPRATEPMDRRRYWELHLGGDRDEPYFVGVATVGRIVCAVEHNGWSASIPGVLRRLSVGARAFNMLNHIEAKDCVGYAVNGDLLVFEEPWGPLTPLSPGDRRWDASWCDGLSDLDSDVWLRGARLRALAERVMGCRLELGWCTGALRTAAVPSPDDLAGPDDWDLP